MAREKIKRRYGIKFSGLVYILMSFVIGLAALNSQTNLLFFAFGVMMSWLIVAGFVSGRMLSGLSIRRVVPEHGAVDRPMSIEYELTNHKRFMPGFAMIISEEGAEPAGILRGDPHAWLAHVSQRSAAKTSAVAWPTHRGVVRFNAIRITSTFPFGIIRKSIIVEHPGEQVVYPRTYRLMPDRLAGIRHRDPIGTRSSRQAGGHEEFYGLREYREGDSIKLIDWRHTARTNELVSRELTRFDPPKLMVLLDLRQKGEPPYFDAAERAISLAASVICDALAEGFEVGMTVAGARCGSFGLQAGRFHRERLMESLGALDLAGDASQAPIMHAARNVRWLIVHAGPIDETIGLTGAAHVSDRQLEAWCRMKDEPAWMSTHAYKPPTETAPQSRRARAS